MTGQQKKVIGLDVARAVDCLSRSLTFLKDGKENDSFHFLMEGERFMRRCINSFINYERLYKQKGVKRYAKRS